MAACFQCYLAVLKAIQVVSIYCEYRHAVLLHASALGMYGGGLSLMQCVVYCRIMYNITKSTFSPCNFPFKID